MSVRIEEVFQVAAPPEQVWAYLTDPQQVAPCLPGANLTEVIDDKTYAGTIKVKVGPVTAGYRGKIQITDQDDDARTVKMLGEGMESSGAGSAKMVLSSQVIALDDGGTEVRVQQDVEVVGKLAQFGRGMVQEVGKQLFRQFVGCAKAHLEAAAAAAPAAVDTESAAGPPPDTEPEALPPSGTEAEDPADPPPEATVPEATPGSAGPVAPAATSVESSAPTASAPPPAADSAAPAAAQPPPPPPAPPAQDEAIGGIGLILRAFWGLLTRPFRKG